MIGWKRGWACVLAALALSACGMPTGSHHDMASGGDSAGDAAQPIGADETISLTGTEPFWGGTVEASKLTYTTPEDPGGSAVAVKRFAGLNGLGFSGTFDGQPLDLAITAEACSDGMSDRRYPFTATLRIRGEQRHGCAWTARTPFSGPAKP